MRDQANQRVNDFRPQSSNEQVNSFQISTDGATHTNETKKLSYRTETARQYVFL